MNIAGEANLLFSHIFSPGEEITLAWAQPYIDSTGKIDHRNFTQKRYNADDTDQLIQDAFQLNQEGHDLWFTPCPRKPGTTGRTKNTSAPGRVVWADCDRGLDNRGRDVAFNILGAHVVYSGSNYVDTTTGEIRQHAHVYVMLTQTYAPDIIEYLNRALGQALSADAKWSSDSLLRIPGTNNHKNTPITDVRVAARSTKEFTAQELADYLNVPDPFSPDASTPEPPPWEGELQPIKGRLPAHINRRVTELAIPGKRSTQRVELIMNAVEWGYTDGQIMWLLDHHLPTQEKYGSRHTGYSIADITAHRARHPHVEQRCASVSCENAPQWMRTQAPTGKQTKSNKPDKTNDTPGKANGAAVDRVLEMSPEVKAKKDRCARVEKLRTDYRHRVALAEVHKIPATIDVQDYFELFTLAAQGHSCVRDAYEASKELKGAKTALVAADAALSLTWPEGMISPCTGSSCGQLTDALELVVRDLVLEEFFVFTADTGTYLVPRCGPHVGRARWELSTRNDAVRGWISQAANKRGFSLGRSGITKAVMEGAIHLLTGMANEVAGAEPPQLHVRSAPYAGGYLIDLGDSSGKFVHVTAQGWTLVDWEEKMPVFSASRAALPTPLPGGDREDFRRHLGFSEASDAWHICWSWAVTAFMSDVQRPLLAFTGPAGAGKTGRTMAMASITDPLEGDVEPGPLPDNEKDFATRMRYSFIPVAGNLDKMSSTTSDRLCLMTTGTSLTLRKLYTNADPYTVVYMRTGIINGIDIRGLKNDALDRILSVELTDSMSEKDMAELNRDRWDNSGHWLGALLDDLVNVLAQIDAQIVDAKERFGVVARASKVLGEEFYTSRCAVVDEERAQRAENDETVLKMADAVLRHIGPQNTAEVTLSDLHETYQDMADEERQRTGRMTDWLPKSALSVGHTLKRTGPALKKMGITYEKLPRTAKRRVIRFTYVPDQADVVVKNPSSSNALMM